MYAYNIRAWEGKQEFHELLSKPGSIVTMFVGEKRPLGINRTQPQHTRLFLIK